MQTQFTKMIFMIMLFFCSRNISAQQALCNQTLTKNLLPITCDYTLLTIDVDDGSSDYDTLFLDQTVFDGPGIYNVTLIASKDNGQTSSCTSIVTMLDVSPPVITVLDNVTVLLNADNQAVLFGSDFDAGTYDACSSNFTFDISQSIFTCSDLGENTIVITATDDVGNSSSASVILNIEDKKNVSIALACNDNIVIPILPNTPILFTSDMMLEGGPYNCPDYYEVQVSFNNIARPNDSLYYSDIGKTLFGKVLDLGTGNSCWGSITVVNDDCANSFSICDTKSKCEPIGDCTSGHTDSDNVEWPCDINEYVNSNVYNNPSPEFLALYLQVPIDDIKPQLIWDNTACNSIAMVYYDTEFNLGSNSKKVQRTWTVLNWLTNNTNTYNQIIILNKIAGECDFCDTLPWNALTGDCASGHTLSDAVEWPADITVNSSSSIAGLLTNILVNANDVKPQLNFNCTLGLSFSDSFVEDGNDVIISRKWDAINWNTLNTATYTQKVTVINVDEDKRTVCVKRRDGSNIDDVKLYAGNTLENGGCKTFDYDVNNKIVTPTKNDNDATTGIDLSDLILLQEYLLGITQLDKFQKQAGDISGNGGITAIDALMLSKIIQGDTSIINNLGSPWRFMNVTSSLDDYANNSISNSADISKAFYSTHFTGYRLGDINDSYSTTTSLPITTVILEDEILNKDEIYEIPVIAKQDYRVKGLQFNINKSDGFEFISAGGAYFDKFTVFEYPTYYQLAWIAETNESMKDGIPVFAGTSMFQLKFRATKNDVMSNSIKFGNETNNRLIAPIHLPSYLLKFGWDNLIPVGTKNIIDRKLKVIPTLVNEQFTVSFDEKEATMILYNMEGKTLLKEKIVSNTEINSSSLLQGLYFITVQYNDGKKEVRKIVKQ